jgi:hypothetical protein
MLNPSISATLRQCLLIPALVAAATLAACGGGTDEQADALSVAEKGKPTFSVGGTVNLSAPLPVGGQPIVLRLTSSAVVVDEVITAAGAYTFDRTLTRRSDFSISVVSAPDYQCLVTGTGAGSISGNVTDANFFCQYVPTYPVRFTVAGLLAGQSTTVGIANPIVLGDETPLVVASANGTYEFPQRFGEGAGFSLFVVTATGGPVCRAASTLVTVGPNVAPTAVACNVVTPQ